MQGLIQMIMPNGRFIFKAILMVFFLAVAYLFFRDNGRQALKKLLSLFRQPWLVAFIACTAYIFSCCIMGRNYSNVSHSVFFGFGLTDGEGNLNADTVANIFMYIPFTFFYIKAFRPRRPFISALLLSVGATLFFEVSQLIGRIGYFQFSDMVHNIIGGLIGCGLWYMIKVLKERRVFHRVWIWMRKKIDHALHNKDQRNRNHGGVQ